MAESLGIDEADRNMIEGARTYCKHFAGSVAPPIGFIMALSLVALVAYIVIAATAAVFAGRCAGDRRLPWSPGERDEPGGRPAMDSLAWSADPGSADRRQHFLPGLSVHAGAPDGSTLFQATIQLASCAA